MLLLGEGLDKHSHMYFYTPSGTARKLLYYPLCAGEFYCNSEYVVEREQYNSFLFLLVLDGKIRYGDLSAEQNEALLIDCYKPHAYYSGNSAHTLWLHFDGNNARELFEQIVSERTAKIKCPADTAEQLREMLNLIKGSGNDFELSKKIYSLLCDMLKPEDKSAKAQSVVDRAKEFIGRHFADDVKVEDMAKAVNMSQTYFSKQFKAVTTLSPYEYLQSVRLAKAKELLLKTDLPISEIAYRTGFNSDANFIYFFKSETGISPLKFRKMTY